MSLDHMAIALVRDKAARDRDFRHRLEAELKRRRGAESKQAAPDSEPETKATDVASMVARHFADYKPPALLAEEFTGPGPSGKDVKIAAARASGLPIDAIVGRAHDPAVVRWRHIVMWVMRYRCPRTNTYPSIGLAVGGRNHCTVIRAIQKIDNHFVDFADDIARVEAVL